MRILVTGGAGFIGSEFCRGLAQNLYIDHGLIASEITVLDSLTYAGNLDNLEMLLGHSNFKFVKGSLQDSELLLDLFSSIDLVVNFAAESHVDNSINNGSSFVSTNVAGVVNLLETLKKYPKLRMVQVSTDEVYGSIVSGSWDEACAVAPNSPYSASKASADLFVGAYVRTHGVNVVTTRCSNNYGPFQHVEKFIPTLIMNLLKNTPLPIYGNGKNVREWIHVGDHCQGIACIATLGKSGDIYNIGTKDEFSNLEIANFLKNISGSFSEIEYVPDRLGHDFRYSLNTSKIKSLGWTSKVDFKEGLTQTFNWYKERYG